MKKYLVKVSIEREVEAVDKSVAMENFWIVLEEECAGANTTTDNLLSDNMKITEIEYEEK